MIINVAAKIIIIIIIIIPIIIFGNWFMFCFAPYSNVLNKRRQVIIINGMMNAIIILSLRGSMSLF